MQYLDSALNTALGTAKGQVRHVVGALLDRAGHHQQSQSLTIGCPQEFVRRFFRDPDRLSEVLGDVGDVQRANSDDRLNWVFRQRPLEGMTWESSVVAEKRRLRFVDADNQAHTGNEITIDFSEAPRGRGTQVTLRVKSSAPGLLSGALAFKALYRARALLQTGEIPTIKQNPSARKSAR